MLIFRYLPEMPTSAVMFATKLQHSTVEATRSSQVVELVASQEMTTSLQVQQLLSQDREPSTTRGLHASTSAWSAPESP